MADEKLCLLFFLALLCAGTYAQLNCTDPDYSFVDCSCRNITGIGVCDEDNGMCNCSMGTGNSSTSCFSLSDTSNCCEVEPCYKYNLVNEECVPQFKSRTTAILLSVFLINFGAANFYIERYDLAIPQIVLGFFLLFLQVGSCAVACMRDDETSIPCIVCCSLNSFISLLFLAWWIADLVILATNTRLDGNDCPLT